MSLDAWLAASGVTWEVVWRRFDLPADRRLRLGCSALATVHRKSQLVRRRAWRYSSLTWNRQYCTLLSELSRRLAQYARDVGACLVVARPRYLLGVLVESQVRTTQYATFFYWTRFIWQQCRPTVRQHHSDLSDQFALEIRARYSVMT